MGELQSTLDALVGEELYGLSNAEVLDRTASLVAARNRIDAELTRTVRHGERTQAAERDGLKTMRSWLIGHGRLAAARPVGWCGRVVRWRTSRRWRPASPTAR